MDYTEFCEKKSQKILDKLMNSNEYQKLHDKISMELYEQYREEIVEEYRHDEYDRQRDDEATEIIQTDAQLGREYEAGKL